MSDTNIDQLNLQIEKERVEYLQKSKHLQEQLKEMRTEIEVLKIGENQTLYDQIHDEQVNLGEDKYSTFRKTKEGSTRSRVAFFEELWRRWSHLAASPVPTLCRTDPVPRSAVIFLWCLLRAGRGCLSSTRLP